MENLNAEAIKTALKCCDGTVAGCEECPNYNNRYRCNIKAEALALITSQEQKIFALENRLKECENGYEGTLHLESCKLHDAEEKVKELTEERKDFEIRALRAENEATKYKDRYETEKQSHDMLSESYDALEKTKDDLIAERSRLIEKCQEAEKINKEKCNLEYTLLGVMHSVDKWLDGKELEQDEVKRAITMREKTLQIVERLAEENERFKDLVKEVQEYNENWVVDNGRLRGILLQFTDIVHKWGNKHGYDTSEISLVSILNEESEIKKQIREETIKEFQSRLNENRGYDDDWNYNSWWGETINQIAKEMLEGEK